MLDFYGADIMLLIGGGLLAARGRLTEETAAFVAAVRGQRHEAWPAISRPRTAKRRRISAGRASSSLPYKEDDRALFKWITRQVLFSDPAMHGELRYFEVAPGGFSTLERHEHLHAVLILRGRGQCLVGDEVRPIETRDLVTVPALAWHQFRATTNEPLGFLCMVNATRDKPQLPSPEDLAKLREEPAIAAFLGSRSSAT